MSKVRGKSNPVFFVEETAEPSFLIWGKLFFSGFLYSTNSHYTVLLYFIFYSYEAYEVQFYAKKLQSKSCGDKNGKWQLNKLENRTSCREPHKAEAFPNPARCKAPFRCTPTWTSREWTCHRRDTLENKEPLFNQEGLSFLYATVAPRSIIQVLLL